jgi:hypothetical protein
MYRAVQQPTGGSRRSGNQRIASTLFLHFNPKAKNKILLRVAETPGTTKLMELFLNDMIPFENFKSVEICANVHRFLIEFAKYSIHKHSTSLHVYTGIPMIICHIYI